MSRVLGLTSHYTALTPEAQLTARRLSTGRHVLLTADYNAVATAIITEIRDAVIADLRDELTALGKQQEALAAEARATLLTVEGVSPP